MPRIFRRTPENKKAIGYGYGDLLKEAVGGMLAGSSRQSRRMLEGRMTNEDFMDLAFAGIGAGVKLRRGAPKAARGLMKMFSKEGLKYDAFTEPLPGYGYHQWTLYGEGPAKGATFGTKTIDVGEMEEKIADLIKKFSE